MHQALEEWVAYQALLDYLAVVVLRERKVLEKLDPLDLQGQLGLVGAEVHWDLEDFKECPGTQLMGSLVLLEKLEQQVELVDREGPV